MSAKQRKPLSESLQDQDLTPAMEAFRKGAAAPEVATPEVPEPPSEKAVKPKNRKLVIELEPELYDAFAADCFHKKVKMAAVLRAFIASHVK